MRRIKVSKTSYRILIAAIFIAAWVFFFSLTTVLREIFK